MTSKYIQIPSNFGPNCTLFELILVTWMVIRTTTSLVFFPRLVLRVLGRFELAMPHSTANHMTSSGDHMYYTYPYPHTIHATRCTFSQNILFQNCLHSRMRDGWHAADGLAIAHDLPKTRTKRFWNKSWGGKKGVAFRNLELKKPYTPYDWHIPTFGWLQKPTCRSMGRIIMQSYGLSERFSGSRDGIRKDM